MFGEFTACRKRWLNRWCHGDFATAIRALPMQAVRMGLFCGVIPHVLFRGLPALADFSLFVSSLPVE
jgi:hypothetical protein